MAVIFPKINLEGTPSSERDFLKKLRIQLSDEYWIFHNIEYLTKYEDTLVEGEVDFLIIHPDKGILDLEVKGGAKIEYDDQTKCFFSTSHLGKKSRIQNDPVSQGRKNINALINKMVECGVYLEKKQMKFTWGNVAVFPGVIFNPPVMPPYYLREIVIDANDLEKLDSKISSIFYYWSKNNKTSGIITQDKLEAIRDNVLATKYELTRSFKIAIKNQEELFIRFTEKQKYAFDKMLKLNKQALIKGYAGTGKTILASLKAVDLHKNNIKTLFLCYNNNLADYLKTQLPNVDVYTFHGFAKKIIEDNDPSMWPSNPSKEFWEEDVAYILASFNISKITYSAIIVDEAQDFNTEWWSIIKMFLNTDGFFYLFYDPNQNIRRTTISLPVTSPAFLLDENCRNTKNINKCVRQYGKIEILDFEENNDGENVETFNVKSHQQLDECLKNIIYKLKNEYKISTRDFCIIHNFNDKDPYKGVAIQGYYHRKYSPTPPKNHEIIYDTINRFKGLEANVLIIINDVSVNSDYQMYVAASRAKHKLFIINIV